MNFELIKMKEYFIFYILLIVLIVLLIFVILLHSDRHSRTIVPGLLSSNYIVDDITNSWTDMKILVDTSTPEGSIVFGNSDSANNYNTVTFVPLMGDEKRRLSGMITLLLGSISGCSVKLRVLDNETGEVIGKEGEFYIPVSNDWGLTPIRLSFKTQSLNPDSATSTEHHQIVVQVKSVSGTISDLVLNSGYVSYY